MNVKRMRGIVIVCSTVLTATAVCISGTIGWVGLIVPHMGRILVGQDNRYLMPTSALFVVVLCL
jgi:iron complex transport system permease protein